MNVVLLCLAVALAHPAGCTSSPVEKTLAYSRQTTPGIPEGGSVAASPGRTVHTSYFIYLVLRKGTVPSVAGVWLKGKYYAATLQKVSSPVLVEHDPAVPTGKKDTLVPATSSAVYQLHPAEEKPWRPKDEVERRLTEDNEVVGFLQANGSTWYSPVKTITPLRPAPSP